ncbi:hypothetical protein BHE74_00055087, partial [Ensete ventricosum]
SSTSESSIHPCLGEVNGGRQSIVALSTIPFTISGKGLKYPIDTRVQKDMNNEFGIYRKHMRNNKTCTRLNKII